MEILRHTTFRFFARRRRQLAFVLVALLAPAGVGCEGGGWSEADREKFYAICGGGKEDPGCQCLARELPKSMSFDEYARFSAASKAMSAEALDDDTLKKMAHAATVCQKP